MMVKEFRSIQGSGDFAHAQRPMWSLIQDHTLFWQLTQFVLIVEPYKLYSEDANRGQGFSIIIMCRKFAICAYVT